MAPIVSCELKPTGPLLGTYQKKKIEHLIYGDHNYGARRAPRPPEGNHWHPEG